MMQPHITLLETFVNQRLYHYSAKTYFDFIKSRRAQGIVPSKEDLADQERRCRQTKSPGIYDKHMSFFIDQIPRDIPRYFGHRHEFWKTGATIYEHPVIINEDLDKNDPDGLVTGYSLVESPYVVELRYNTDFKNDAAVKRYFEKVQSLQRQHRDVGWGYQGLRDCIQRWKGKCNQHFEKLLTIPDFEEIILPRYAATVPHLLLWTPSGTLPVYQIREIKLS